MKQNYFLIGTQPKTNYNFLKKMIIGGLLLTPFLQLSAQSSTVLADFESANDKLTQTAAITMGTYNGIVANPSPVGNTSPKVAKYTRAAGGNFDRLYFNSFATIPNATKFSAKVYTIAIDVYTTVAQPADGLGIPVFLDLEKDTSTPGNWPTGMHSEYKAALTQSNAWQTITFTYDRKLDTNVLSTQINQICLMFNAGKGPGSDVYYFDNIRIVMPSDDLNNLALGQPAVASSGNATNAANAVDGDITTRSDNPRNTPDLAPFPYVYVDLGASYDIKHITAIWEGAYAEIYDILISDDPSFPTNKTTVKNYINSAGLFPAGPFPLKNDWQNGTAVLGTGRYVQILERRPGTGFDYALYELQVFGSPVAQTQLGIDSATGEETPTITLHPNPASDYVKLSFPENVNNKVISIYDLSGKQVLQTKLDDAAVENVVNINQLSKGTYILNIKSEGKSWSKKLIKE